MLIDTDLEPDDILALQVIFQKLQGVPFIQTLVGEGGNLSTARIDKVQQFIDMAVAQGTPFKNSDVQILPGSPSSKPNKMLITINIFSLVKQRNCILFNGCF